MWNDERKPSHGAMAPLFRLRLGLGIISSGSIYSLAPIPSQCGQAPNGLLKENSRGSISSIVKPETGQANLEEKTVRSPLSAFST